MFVSGISGVMEISIDTAGEWLHRQGIRRPHLRFHELGGGVSNRVIIAEASEWRAVMKQSLPKLRVEREWLSDRTRIFREATAMRWLHAKVEGGRVPKLLIEDRENYTLAMEAAPSDATMWKDLLFAGTFNEAHADAAGRMLGSIIGLSFQNDEARELFHDQTVFDQLRLDPYYRFTAQQHPQFAGYFQSLIERCQERAVSLVHGDWSPKNLLVAEGDLWAIDWEVVHFGDPSFDMAFLLNHLLLKSVAMPDHRASLARLARVFVAAVHSGWVEDGALEHLPALLLARIDGKSPAEYLTEPMRNKARELAMSMITARGWTLEEAFAS